MPLHLDYRPKSFDEIVGNEATVDSLRVIFDRKSDWPHALLFFGPKGCGKTTLARIIVGLLGGDGVDFVEINSSNDRGIDMARTIIEGARFRPVMGRSRVYLLDEVHMTSRDFQNAILKPLEDAPAHTYYILCTTDPSKLIPALLSRCNIFEVKNLSEKEIVLLLGRVLEKEKVGGISLEVLRKIADVSEGCPRDALKILDQVIDLEPDKMKEAVDNFSYGDKETKDLYNMLAKKQGWKRISAVISQMDLSNPESARRGMIGYAASIVMSSGDKTAALIFDCFKEPVYNTGKAGFEMAAFRAMVELEGDAPPF
jgi:DNA polymerase III subunit gamma/tau